MNSLEWRVRELENKLLGSSDNNPQTSADLHPTTLIEQLERAAKSYKYFLDNGGQNHVRFVDLLQKNKDLVARLDKERNSAVSNAAKTDLVISYEDDLKKHFESISTIASKSERVLDVEKWPDFTGLDKRLNNLQTVTREQHLQSLRLDRKTEELIEVYNEIINSIQKNMALWSQKLDTLENQERDKDEDV